VCLWVSYFLHTVLGGVGSTSNRTTGAGTGVGPLLAVGPGQLGQHSSYSNLGNTSSGFQSKHDMSPAQRREKGNSSSTVEVRRTCPAPQFLPLDSGQVEGLSTHYSFTHYTRTSHSGVRAYIVCVRFAHDSSRETLARK